MQKTLFLKKTIAILAIILGAVRLLSCIYAFPSIYNLAIMSLGDKEIQNYLKICIVFLPLELLATVAIFTLGILLLCVDKGVSVSMPRIKSRRIALSILITSISYLIMEAIIFASTPTLIQEPITIFFSIGFVCIFVIICSLGLRPVLNFETKELLNTNKKQTTINTEIAEELKELSEKKEN